MAFTKRDIKDRVVQYPKRYKFVAVSGQTDTYDLVPVAGTITEAGTAINKAYLQPIEDNLSGIGDGTIMVQNAINASNADTVDNKHATDFMSSELLSYRQITNSNLAIITGTYYSTSADPNKPPGVTDGSLFVLAYSAVWVNQVYIDWRTNATYIRSCNNGVWSAWKNISVPLNHASGGGTYGLGTAALVGHVAIRNDLGAIEYEDGWALSAYQGKVLNDKITLKGDVFSLVRTLNVNISAPVAVPLIESDFTDYDEVLLVLRGSISMTSSTNLEQFTIGLGKDTSSMELNLLQHFVPSSTTVSRTLETITAATISDKYFSNEKVWSRAIGLARIIGGNFVVSFNSSRITASGTVYLDIYRRKII